MMPNHSALPMCLCALGGPGGWGGLAAAFVFSFFLAVSGLWFYLGSHLVVSVHTRLESRLESTRPSRTHTGDAVTACIPLLWSASLLAHATETAAGFEDGAAGSLITVSISGYQWGWSYVIPNDVLAAWRASSMLAGRGAAVSAAGPAGVSSTCGAESWDAVTACDVAPAPRGLLSIDTFGGLQSAAAGTPMAVPRAFGRRSAWAPARASAAGLSNPGESPHAVYPPSTRARTAASVGPAVAGPAAVSAVAVSGEPSWPRVGALAGTVLAGIRYRRLGLVMATLFAGHHMHRSSAVHCCGLPGGDWGGGPTGGPTRAPAKMPAMVPVLFDWRGNLTRPLAKAPNLFAAASQIALQPRLPYAVLVNRAARASGDHTVPELIVSPTHPLVIVRWRAAFLARGQILSPFVRLLPISMRFRCGWMYIRPGGLAEFRRTFLDWDARSQLGAGVQGKPVAASLPSSLGGSGSGGGTEVPVVQGKPVAASLPSSLGGSGSGGGTEVPVVQGKPVAASLPSSLGGSGSGGGAKVSVVQGKQGKSRMAGLLQGYSDERGTGVSEVLGSSSGTKVLDSEQGAPGTKVLDSKQGPQVHGGQVKSVVAGSSSGTKVLDGEQGPQVHGGQVKSVVAGSSSGTKVLDSKQGPQVHGGQVKSVVAGSSSGTKVLDGEQGAPVSEVLGSSSGTKVLDGEQGPQVHGGQVKSVVVGSSSGTKVLDGEQGAPVSEVLGSSSGTKVLDSKQGPQVHGGQVKSVVAGSSSSIEVSGTKVASSSSSIKVSGTKVVSSSSSIEVSGTEKVKKTTSMPLAIKWPTMSAKLLADPASCAFYGKTIRTWCDRLGYQLSGQDPAGWLKGASSLQLDRAVEVARGLSRTPGVDGRVVEAFLDNAFAPGTPQFPMRVDIILSGYRNEYSFNAFLDDVGRMDKPLLDAIVKVIEQPVKGALPSGSGRAAMLKLSARRCLHD